LRQSYILVDKEKRYYSKNNFKIFCIIYYYYYYCAYLIEK
jgi:hypothetical protein